MRLSLSSVVVVATLAGCAHASHPAIEIVPPTPPAPPAHAETSSAPQSISELGDEDSLVEELGELIEETPDSEELTPPPLELPITDSDVPLRYNAKVQMFLNYFATRGRDRFELWLSRSGAYIPMMQQILLEEGLPPDLVYLALIESGFSPYAHSSASAVGYWQFISATGKRYGLRIDDWVDERRNPEKATRAAARYLKDLYAMFGDWHLAAAGYNAGENKIARGLRKYDTSDYWELVRHRYLARETKEYVPKLIAAITIAKNPLAFGFAPNYHDPYEYTVAFVPAGTDLAKIAYAADVSYPMIKRMNSELRKWLTPPNVAMYAVHIPPDAAHEFARRLAEAPPSVSLPFKEVVLGRRENLQTLAARHAVSPFDLKLANPGLEERAGATVRIPVGADGARYVDRPARQGRKTVVVRAGDTLWGIAKRHHVSPSKLAKFNGIKGGIIRPGQRIRIP